MLNDLVDIGRIEILRGPRVHCLACNTPRALSRYLVLSQTLKELAIFKWRVASILCYPAKAPSPSPLLKTFWLQE